MKKQNLWYSWTGQKKTENNFFFKKSPYRSVNIITKYSGWLIQQFILSTKVYKTKRILLFNLFGYYFDIFVFLKKISSLSLENQRLL